MRRVSAWAVAMCILLASLVAADGPDNLMFSNPQTDPPNSTWAKEQVRRVNNCKPPCAGGVAGTATSTSVPAATNTTTRTPTPASTATAVATFTPVVFVNGGTADVTCNDSGDGARGTLTFSPSASIMRVTNNDPDGCDVTLGESGAAQGYFVWIQDISVPNLRFATQAGVLLLPHDVHFLEFEYTLQLKYDNGQWVQINPNEASLVLETQHYLNDAGDVPPSFGSSTTECQSMCVSPALAGQDTFFYVTPGGFHTVQLTDQSCPCSGGGSPNVGTSNTITGSGSSVVGSGNTAIDSVIVGVNNTGDGCYIFGEANTCTTTGRSTIIGNQNAVDGPGLVIANNDNAADFTYRGESLYISYSTGATAVDLTGDFSIIIGDNIVSASGDLAVCIGADPTCDGDHGVCIGDGCINSERDFTFGAVSEPLHPRWPGVPPSLVSCGTGATIDSAATDVVGKINVGTGAPVVMTCSFNFARTWASEPSCFVVDETQFQVFKVVATTTSLTFDVAVDMASDVIRYGCPVSP